MKRYILPTFLISVVAIISYFFVDKKLAHFFASNPCCIKSFLGEFSRFGISKYYLIVSFLVAVITYKYSKKVYRASLYIFSTLAISGIVIILIKVIFARYRPPMLFNKELYGFNWFDFGYLVNSFPSGHSATAFSLFVALSLLAPKYKWVFLIFASLIALSRVALGVHFFSDILIGSLIGALTSIYLYSKFYRVKA